MQFKNKGNTINKNSNLSKGPGVYVPPPLFYVLTFISAIYTQKKFPIPSFFFRTPEIKIAGIIVFVAALYFLSSSLRQFFKTKNTVVLIKPASSLQTSGIYGISRNPMYVGLSFLYLGVTCFIGNSWNIILFPLLFLILQEYVIKKEENYLVQEFGKQYKDYKIKVRRWL